LTLYTDSCKFIRHVASPTVGFPSKLKLFSLDYLGFWPFDL